MSEKNSTLVQQSRYVVGGQTEVNTNRLEWWERTVFSTDPSDTFFTVNKSSEGRLDLIAAALLGDSHLWWFIAQYNAILDPFSEITIGRQLRVPSPNRVKSLLVGRTGGYASTREVPLSVYPIV